MRGVSILLMRLLTLLMLLCATLCYAQEKEPINRTWTSIAGTKVDAELVSFTDREVVLKLKDGKTIKLRLDKLAEYDRYFLKGLEKAIVPEGGIKYHQLDDNFLDIIQGKKGNKEYIHYLNKKRFSGVAYKMRPNPDRDLFTKPTDEGYFTNDVWDVITFKNGMPNGVYKNFHGNGQKSSEEILDGKKGVKNGLSISWSESGKIISVKNYKDGEVVKGSEKFWNSKGEPVNSRKEAYKINP